VEEVEAPLAAPYSDENEGGDQAAFEEGSGEGPPLMLVWMLRMVALRGAHYVYQYLYFNSI